MGPSALLREIRFSLSHLTVEPIGFLVFFGWSFANTFQSPYIYRKICQVYYAADSSVNCSFLVDGNVEDSVQMRNAEWSIFIVLSFLIPVIFADIIIGSFGDRHGRKLPLLIAIVGVGISEYGYLLTLSSISTPFWTILIFGFFAGLTGYISIIPMTCYAYLADVTEEPHLLTLRAGIYSAIQTTASGLGGFLAAAFASVLTVSIAIDVELVLLLLSCFYVLYRIPQKPGLREIERKTRKVAPIVSKTVTRSNNNNEEKKKAVGKSGFDYIAEWTKRAVELLVEGVKVLVQPREGHRRSFILISMAALVVCYTTAIETRTSGIIYSFVFRRTDDGSLAWSLRNLGLWQGFGYLMWLAGDSDALMYIANAAGLFSGLALPAVAGFLIQIVPMSEIGRVFSLFAIGADLSCLLATVIYSNIYRATVSWSASFVWFLMSGVQFIAVLAILWVHVLSRRQGMGASRVQPITSVRHAISRIGEESHANDLEMMKERERKEKSKIVRSIASVAERMESANSPSLWESSEDLRRVDRNISFY
ncbi:hypothetical protein WR25_18571 [Diploscapter pachys]|uniref:Major facilitator superfamily (MFS) profile domain-containing protein n=1 Tax=Diploscapter pachys TaxID=2018661 RepID=A0A2A2K8V4_9BILA|nr:hypothetical protein WR25_18571 [Diploscapter pachys]